MTRGLAVLVAAVAMLAASGNAQAESFDLRDIMGGGPDFRGYGDSSKPRDPTGYPPDVLADDGFALVEHLGLGDGDYDLGDIRSAPGSWCACSREAPGRAARLMRD